MSILSPKFMIGSIRIGSIEGASCLNMGNNFPNNFTSHKKHHQGFGTVIGDQNEIKGILSKLENQDTIDLITKADSEDTPQWVKDLITSALKDQQGDSLDDQIE
ncbi:hypothetical protein ACFSCX_14020 [Bacillus salitolerans]|uniref:Spore germination protein n=1 Tax=Bacillus salitolerans TaxID=1437434 RepID=A0ABW4LR60_9BACI